MLPRFIVITRQYAYLQYFFVNEMFFAGEKKWKIKENQILRISLKNHNVIVSQIDLLPMISIFLFFLFQI